MTLARAAAILLATTMIPASVMVQAELSVDISDGRTSTILMTIGDDIDPVGFISWEPKRNILASRILNPNGHTRGDGRPDIDYRSNSWPVVTWAYNAGSDFDIAFSEWTGTEWSTFEFLTGSLTDELDPRIFVETDGAIHVVWWEDGPSDSVYMLSRDPAGVWDLTPALVASDGRRPSVAVRDGILHVVYERDSDQIGMNQDIVVARQEPGLSFVPEIIISTERTDRLDAILHVDGNHLWADWKHANGEINYTEALDEDWTAPAGNIWPDPSWLGVEEVRRTVREALLGS